MVGCFLQGVCIVCCGSIEFVPDGSVSVVFSVFGLLWAVCWVV